MLRLKLILFFTLSLIYLSNCVTAPDTTVHSTLPQFPRMSYEGFIAGFDGSTSTYLSGIKVSICYNNFFSACDCVDATYSDASGNYSLYSETLHNLYYYPIDYYVVATDVDGTDNKGYFLESAVLGDCLFPSYICYNPYFNLILNGTDDAPTLANENCTTTTTVM